MLQTVLSLVEAEQGVSIVHACARNLRSNGVRFYRLQPDDVRVELVAAWETANHCTHGGESAPVYTPVSYSAIGNDKIGGIAQEPVMPPALTCIRGENNR